MKQKYFSIVVQSIYAIFFQKLFLQIVIQVILEDLFCTLANIQCQAMIKEELFIVRICGLFLECAKNAGDKWEKKRKDYQNCFHRIGQTLLILEIQMAKDYLLGDHLH